MLTLCRIETYIIHDQVVFFLHTDCQARLDGSLIIAYASTTFMLVCAAVTQAEVFNRKDCGPPDNYEASVNQIYIFSYVAEWIKSDALRLFSL